LDDVASAGRACSLPRPMVIRAWRTLVDIMRIRQERSRARYQLAAMTERELLDCGMSRSEIEYELRRPRRRR